MNRTKAIKINCLDCAGETAKEVLLCPVFDCPLWNFRLGPDSGTAAYRRRMEVALTNYAEDVAEMRREGLDVARFAPNAQQKPQSGRKHGFRGSVGRGTT
jgi:hypothetical protein